MTLNPMKTVLLTAIMMTGLSIANSARATTVHEVVFDFTNNGQHDVNADNQPSVTFANELLPTALGLNGTFDLIISASAGDGINTSVSAGIGVQGAPDGNRIGVGETLSFQINNVFSNKAIQGVQFMDAQFSHPSATTASNRLENGDTASIVTTGGNANIAGDTGQFLYAIPGAPTSMPANGSSATFGAAAGEYQIAGLRVGFVDESLDATPLQLTFGNADNSSPGVEAVNLGSGNTGSTIASGTAALPAELGGGLFQVNVESVGGNININSTGIGVQGAPNSSRLGAGETVTISFSGLPTEILGVRVLDIRSDTGNATNALLAENEVATYLTSGGSAGLIFGSDTANTFLGLNSNRTLLSFESITFGYDGGLSGTPGTGATGYRIAGLNLEFITATPVPEPATFALLGLAGIGLARRRRQAA